MAFSFKYCLSAGNIDLSSSEVLTSSSAESSVSSPKQTLYIVTSHELLLFPGLLSWQLIPFTKSSLVQHDPSDLG